MDVRKLVTISALGLLLASCSNESKEDIGDSSAKTVSFSAYTAVSSRVHSNTAMSSPYLVRITNKGYTAANGLTAERKVAADGSYETLYWDQVSSTDADVRTLGATVTALSDPRSSGAIESIPVDGKLSWKVNADQQKGDGDGDLLISDYIDNQIRTKDPVQLCFHHAMTKITINIINSGEFDDATVQAATVSLPAQNTAANIDLTKADGVSNMKAVEGNNAATVNMRKLETPNTYTDGTNTQKYTASFECIVAPGKIIENNANKVLSTINLANISFNLTEAQVEEKWGDTLKSGCHYVIAVRMTRTHTSINAVVNDWKEGGQVNVTEQYVTYENDINGEQSIDKALQSGGFSIFRAESTETTFGDAAQTYSYDNSVWTPSEEIYWKDGLTRYYYRALSPNTLKPVDGKLTVSDGTEDYLFATTPAFTWGAEEIGVGAPVPPRTGPVNLTFSHVMSKITINFNQVPTSDGGVDVSNVSITLKNAKTSAVLGLMDGTLSNYVTPASGFTTGSNNKTCEFFSIPQNLGGATPTNDLDNLLLEITAAGNTYRVYLKDIIDIDNNSKQTTIQDWEPGKHYVYTFNLYKKKVLFSASVLDWADGGTTNGNVTL